MKVLRLQPVLFPAALLLSGCRPVDAHSPTLDVLGSYFPAWMMCIILGIFLTLISRQILIGLKLNAHLRLPAIVYPCMTILWTLVVWLVCFKN